MKLPKFIALTFSIPEYLRIIPAWPWTPIFRRWCLAVRPGDIYSKDPKRHSPWTTETAIEERSEFKARFGGICTKESLTLQSSLFLKAFCLLISPGSRFLMFGFLVWQSDQVWCYLCDQIILVPLSLPHVNVVCVLVHPNCRYSLVIPVQIVPESAAAVRRETSAK